MSNQDNKMASWLKFIVLGVGAAGALYGAVKLLMGHQEPPHESSSCPRSNSARRRRSVGRETGDGRECAICSENSVEFVHFLPCLHNDTCVDCGARIKKCITCKRPIAERVTSDGRTVPYKPSKISDDMMCTICCEYKKRIIFNCGHTVCKSCSIKLNECPMCRTTITSKSPFY